MSSICNYCRPPKSLATASNCSKHISNNHPHRCTICMKDFTGNYTWLNHRNAEHKDLCAYCDEFIGKDRVARENHIRKHNYYPCTICLRSYNKHDCLEEHYRNPGMHMFRCNKCNKELDCNRDFWFHSFESHGELCPLCDSQIKKNFNSKVQWDDHLRTVHYLHPCSECYEVFQNSNECKVHHKDKHRISCSVCSEAFPDEESKDYHFKNRHKFICNYCPEFFPDAVKKQEHVNNVHRFKCSICQELFVTELEFQHHYNDIHRFKCSHCPNCFPTNADREKHINETHQVQCNICNKYLNNNEEMRHHYETEHQFKCSICGMILDNETDRNRHANVVHLIRCQVCGLHLDSIAMKDEHYNSVHQLPCDLCTKLCITVSELQLHCTNMHAKTYDADTSDLWIESDDDNIEDMEIRTCYVCSKECPSEEELVNHYIGKHINECVTCEAQFSTEEELLNHQIENHVHSMAI